jgi:hypothetical protein
MRKKKMEDQDPPFALVEAKGGSVSVISSSGREIIDDRSCDHIYAESSRPILRTPYPLDSSRSAMIIRCQEYRPRRDDGMKFLALHGRGVVADCVRMFSRGPGIAAVWSSGQGGLVSVDQRRDFALG